MQCVSICGSHPCGFRDFDPDLTLFSGMIQAYSSLVEQHR